MKFDVKIVKYLALVSQIGLNMAIPIFGCTLFGYWLDTKVGTNGVFLIIFILIGVYVSFRNLFITILGKIDNGKKDHNERK